MIMNNKFDARDHSQVFETIFYKSADGMLIIENGKFVECNDTVVKLLKYKTKEEFLNVHPSEISPEFQPDGRTSFQRAEENTKIVLEKGSHSFEWVHKKADGELFWVEVVLTNISSDDKTMFLVVWRDIDERKKLRKKLEELNKNLEEKVKQRTNQLEQYSEIISKNVIYSKSDVDGIIVDVSEAFCEISGYTKEELIGKPHNIVRHPDMPSSVYTDLWSSIKSGKAWNGQLKNLKKDSSYYWIDINITPEYSEEGIINGYTSVRHDITSKIDLRELSESLEQRVEKELEKNRQKDERLLEITKMAQIGEMIENIAHQWRQPLATISATVTNIEIKSSFDTLKDEELSKLMKDISHQTHYLSKTINTFRNFLKAKKELKEVVLQENIEETLYIMETMLKDNYIQLINNVENNNPIIMTMVVGELSQVIINIINNAKFILLEKKIEKPWIKVELQQYENKAVLTIEDNAGGIPDEILPKIFESHFTTKDEEEGTGLGLHMSHKIVRESFNGKLHAENTENGAKFFVELAL